MNTIWVLKNIPELKKKTDDKVLITSDRTPQEMKTYKNVKAKLLERKKQGKNNLKIIYRNGIPSIIEINESSDSEIFDDGSSKN